MIAAILAGLALVAALSALGIAVHTWRSAPGARLWAELRLRIEDLEVDNDALHQRHVRSTRVENVTKATEARKAKRTVLDEAQEVLAASAAPAPAQGALPLAGSEEQQLMQVRKLAGLH